MATVGMSLDRYNSLSEEHRKIIDEVAAEAPRKSAEFNDRSVDAAVDTLCEKKGELTVTVFSPEEAEKVRHEAVEPLQAAWIKRAETEANVDGSAMMDQARKSDVAGKSVDVRGEHGG